MGEAVWGMGGGGGGGGGREGVLRDSWSSHTHHFTSRCLFLSSLETVVQFTNYRYTVKPPNKGHFGNNINSSLLSFVKRLSSSRRYKMY